MDYTDFSTLGFYMGFIFGIKNKDSNETIALYKKINDILIDIIINSMDDNIIKNQHENEIILQQNLFKNNLINILQNLFEPNFEFNLNLISKLTNLSKSTNKMVLQKINILIDIMTNPWYDISENNDYYELCIFFFSKFISLYRKINLEKNVELNKITQKINIINRIINCLTLNSDKNTVALNQMNLFWHILQKQSDINKKNINLLIELCRL